MSRVHVFAGFSHYADHLLPVWRALPPDCRGEFVAGSGHLTDRLRCDGVPVRRRMPSLPPGDVVLVAGYNDLRRVRHRRVALLDHGAGQTYPNVQNGSYVGAPGRGRVGLFLHPHLRTMLREQTAYPDADHVVVGSPRLDVLWERRQRYLRGSRCRVAVSFHWPCELKPETGWAFPEWRDEVPRLVDHGFEVIGHGHPRAWRVLLPYWRGVSPSVDAVPDWASVVEQADVYVCDNSSTLFEAAAVGVPVLLLNGDGWPTDGELRFGLEGRLLGPGLWPGDSVTHGVTMARCWDAGWRRAAVEATYANLPDGRRAATGAAVEALVSWAG